MLFIACVLVVPVCHFFVQLLKLSFIKRLQVCHILLCLLHFLLVACRTLQKLLLRRLRRRMGLDNRPASTRASSSAPPCDSCSDAIVRSRHGPRSTCSGSTRCVICITTMVAPLGRSVAPEDTTERPCSRDAGAAGPRALPHGFGPNRQPPRPPSTSMPSSRPVRAQGASHSCAGCSSVWTPSSGHASRSGRRRAGRSDAL